MAKKLILVWLTLLMVLFSSISIYADENVQGDFFVKHVVINGEEIINYNLQYPFFMHDNTLYFPLTPEMGEICGISAQMDWESRTLKLLKTDSTRKNISSNWMKNDNQDLNLLVLPDVTVLAYTETVSAVLGGIIETPVLSVDTVDMGELPVLMADNSYFYLPFRVLTAESNFNWDIYYNPYFGVCVSTDPNIPAESYCDKGELVINQGLVAYMQRYNPNMSTSVGQNLLFFFKRAATVYGVDEKLLMAVAHKESNFNHATRARGGAVGLMQIMPSTGARYGLSLDALFDPYTNICFGAMYISDRINAYNGDWEKGLSAYNQGSLAVNRGSYSNAYAMKVISAYNGISSFLEQNGYVYFEPIELSAELGLGSAEN